MASALAKQTYNVFFRRSSSYVLGIFASAFVFEMAFDSVSDRIWDSVNRGRQWKDIRDKYIQ
ncbi:cytochrome b-c1 complex subunit 9 [Phlyctochytrium arcticum]|nr:cytochrome b-c1 complex subunit 9 [Phlyctochytrium arcticum]